MKYLILIFFTSILFFNTGCFKDPNVDVYIAPCDTVTCQNSGYCLEINNGARCECVNGYFGSSCQYNRVVIDSIVIYNYSANNVNGNPIETASEGNPDFFLELSHSQYNGAAETLLNTTNVINEVPLSTKTTFVTNWTYLSSFFADRYNEIRVMDQDAGGDEVVRYIAFDRFNTYRGLSGNQVITKSDASGQFEVSLYFSYN